jgi:hypothetical protein
MDLRLNNKLHKTKRKRRAVINLLFLMVLVISCKKSIQSNREFPFENLTEKLDKILTDSINGKQIDIAELTPFEWEQLYIFKPYTPISVIDAELGYVWTEAEKTFINQEEGFDLLVFTKNDTVVNYIKWFRNKGDFSRVNRIKYQPSNAKFIYKKERFGEEDWLFLYEKK